jgi:hypothetical protein
VSNPAHQRVERPQQTGVVVGLVALVIEGTFAILSLAAVAFITSFFLAKHAAMSVRTLLPRRRRSAT